MTSENHIATAKEREESSKLCTVTFNYFEPCGSLTEPKGKRDADEYQEETGNNNRMLTKYQYPQGVWIRDSFFPTKTAMRLEIMRSEHAGESPIERQYLYCKWKARQRLAELARHQSNDE